MPNTLERIAEEQVIRTAIAFMDQLCSFNNFYHPEVHRRALDLQSAIDFYHRHGHMSTLTEQQRREAIDQHFAELKRFAGA